MARRIPVFLFVAAALVGSLLVPVVSADQSKPPKEDYYELHKLLVDTLDQIERNYVKEITRRQLVEAAIKGLLNELDPYSAYIGPDTGPAR
jgi:carboxyl-terminal processing protease